MAQKHRSRNRRLIVLAGILAFIGLSLIVLFHTHRKPAPKPEPRTPDVFVWIYGLDKAKAMSGGTLDGIVEKCKANGIAGIIVCSNRGNRQLNRLNDVWALGTLADTSGMVFIPYGRFLARDTKGEIDRTIGTIYHKVDKDHYVVAADGYMFDMEAEYENSAGADHAEAVIGNAKRWCQGNGCEEAAEMFGYTSFGLPSLHPDFPWAKLEASTDFFAPQWYTTSWRKTQGWSFEESRRRITAEFRDYDKDRLAPVLQAYGKNSGFEYVSPDELTAMLRFCKNMDVSFISIFRYELMDEEHWKAIRKFTGADKRQEKEEKKNRGPAT